MKRLTKQRSTGRTLRTVYFRTHSDMRAPVHARRGDYLAFTPEHPRLGLMVLRAVPGSHALQCVSKRHAIGVSVVDLLSAGALQIVHTADVLTADMHS